MSLFLLALQSITILPVAAAPAFRPRTTGKCGKNKSVWLSIPVLFLFCLLLVQPVAGADLIVNSSMSLTAGNYHYDTLKITNNATLTLQSNTALTGFKGVNITATNLIVDPGASISANGRGIPPIPDPEQEQIIM